MDDRVSSVSGRTSAIFGIGQNLCSAETNVFCFTITICIYGGGSRGQRGAFVRATPSSLAFGFRDSFCYQNAAVAVPSVFAIVLSGSLAEVLARKDGFPFVIPLT